jgi:hypothetical protein
MGLAISFIENWQTLLEGNPFMTKHPPVVMILGSGAQGQNADELYLSYPSNASTVFLSFEIGVLNQFMYPISNLSILILSPMQ